MKARLEQVHPILGAQDVAASLCFFERLGFSRRYVDDETHPRYAAVGRDGVELHIQWADAGQWAHAVDRPAYRFLVDDVDALYREFVASGGVTAEASDGSPWTAPADTPWGTREFHLRDPGRSSLQFYQLHEHD